MTVYVPQTFNLEQIDVDVVVAETEKMRRQGLRASKSDAARKIIREWVAMRGENHDSQTTQVSAPAGQR
jgi:Arc/MetJ-type ribon-helix-helix transcriptional regulator